MLSDAEIVEAMCAARFQDVPGQWTSGMTAGRVAIERLMADRQLAAQRAMGLVLVPVDMWKLEAVKDAYAQFLADAGLKNAPSLEHLLPRLIAAAQGGE
jgi:hypothetical protein